MTDRDWIRIATIDQIPLREGRLAHVRGREIAIFNLGDRVLAIDNRCPHKGGPLADGIVSGQSVVCPLHAWKIDLATGTVERPAATSACIEPYPVRVIDGMVLLALPANADDARSGEAA